MDEQRPTHRPSGWNERESRPRFTDLQHGPARHAGLSGDGRRRRASSCLPTGVPLSLQRPPHVPPGSHPIIVEIWRVQDGLIEVAGLYSA